MTVVVLMKISFKQLLLCCYYTVFVLACSLRLVNLFLFIYKQFSHEPALWEKKFEQTIITKCLMMNKPACSLHSRAASELLQEF